MRGICAIFVVFEHFCEQGSGNAFAFSHETSVSAHIFLRLIYGVARTAVPIFFLLSGYLSINSFKQKLGKVINLFFMVSVYSVIGYLLSEYVVFDNGHLLLSANTLNFKAIIWKAFPRNYYLYLFCAVYVVSPFLNKLAHSINKKNYFKLLLSLFVLFSLWSTAINILFIVTGDEGYPGVYFTSYAGTAMGFNFANFSFLYLTGGFLRLHCKMIHLRKNRIIAILIIVISTLITTIGTFFTTSFSKVFVYYDSIFIIIPAISLMYLFITWECKQNKFASFLGRHTFGTFLLHSYVTAFLEKFISLQSIVSQSFAGVFLGILIFVFLVYFISLIITAMFESAISSIGNRWKNTKLYNFCFYSKGER